MRGSATAPGIDGSDMAQKGVVVVVLQYRWARPCLAGLNDRLGVLGFLPPILAPSSTDPNLGLVDVINGLKAVVYYAGLIGGDPRKVTAGGQSSGAGMIRGV